MSQQSTSQLKAEDVRKVAKLACLRVAEKDVEQYRQELSSVLGYAERLRSLDLGDVVPLTRPFESSNRFAPDEPTESLSNAAMMELAPDKHERFLRVPKVLGDGGGA